MRLNVDQTKYINLQKGCFLILAGAGSGKTLIITQRFMNLANIVPSNMILCVTFSNKAANEIESRILKNNPEMSGLWIGTFHSIAFRCLMMHQKLHEKTIIIDEYDKRKILIQLGLLDYIDKIYDAKTPKHVYDQYKLYCEQHHLIDFDYILKQLHYYLTTDHVFRAKITQQFEYIMVDEYQDTSQEQQEIIQLIMNNNVLCVGDADQAIYTWRNASIDNILNFKNNFPNAEIYTLLQNYRCSGNIVKLSNEIIKHNKYRYNNEAKTDNEPGYKPMLVYMHKKTLGEFIVNEVTNNNGTTAILVRTSMMIKKVEDELLKHNITYTTTYNQGLVDKKEFKIILAYIHVLCGYGDLYLDIFCQYPKRNIGPKKISMIRELNINIIDAIQQICPQEYERISSWFECNSIYEHWNCLLSLTGYDENNIIIQQIKLYIFKYNSIKEFITAAMLRHFDNNSVDNNCIYVMTMHAAKGLEFDNVLLPYLVEGCMPCRTSIQNNNIEEERRLMYVAVTRAKTKLYLLYNLNDSPQNNFFGISRFLANIPHHLIRSISI